MFNQKRNRFSRLKRLPREWEHNAQIPTKVSKGTKNIAPSVNDKKRIQTRDGITSYFCVIDQETVYK